MFQKVEMIFILSAPLIEEDPVSTVLPLPPYSLNFSSRLDTAP